MQRRTSSVNVSLEEDSHRDVGVLELVADPHTGKRGIRRVFPDSMNDVQPDPDTTSIVHLDVPVSTSAESVQAQTQTQTRRRPSLSIKTQLDAAQLMPQTPPASARPRRETSSTVQTVQTMNTTQSKQTVQTIHTMQSTTSKPQHPQPQLLNVVRALRDSLLWKERPSANRPAAPPDAANANALAGGLPYANGSIQALGNAWKGKEKEVNVGGLFQDNEGDKLSVEMDDARRNRLVAKAREIREWMKGRSMHRAMMNAQNGQNGNANTNTTSNVNVTNANASAHPNDNINGQTMGGTLPRNNSSSKRKPGPGNTGSGMRELFKGRRQNNSNNPPIEIEIQPPPPTPPGAGAAPPLPQPTLAPPRSPISPRRERGPRPGQTYEIYDQKILENTNERTVELATWREQALPVKKHPSDQEDKISIYYITADDYPEEDRPMAKVEWRVDGAEVTEVTDLSGTGSAGMLGMNGGARARRPSYNRNGSSYHSKVSDARKRQSYHGHPPDHPPPKKERNTKDGHRKRPHVPHTKSAPHNGGSESRIASPTSPISPVSLTSPIRTRDGTISPTSSERDFSSVTATEKRPQPPRPAQKSTSGSKFVENINRTTSASANANASPPSPVPRSPKSGTPRRGLRHTGRRDHFPVESTPIATSLSQGPHTTTKTPSPAGLAPPSVAGTAANGRSVSAPPSASSPPALTVQIPFTATRDSGSTISSIKSTPSLQFEGLLQSCEPSLVHIAPALRQLGIRHLEHLRAVGKLTPTTRDREVREGALRLGITVVEWAILLDRILAL